MISDKSRTKEWILGIREEFPGRDSILIEKLIFALSLLEDLRLSGLDFIFKGGTSLILLLGTPTRFSIDIDITLHGDVDLNQYFSKIIAKGTFSRYEESIRIANIPKRHFKFFFQSVIQGQEITLLLDILFEENFYTQSISVPIQSSILSQDGQTTEVICPSVECLLGDKLTAYAPHTTGIQYGIEKQLEMVKQLFDVAILFNVVSDVSETRITFSRISQQEISYRGFVDISLVEVLWDAINTSILIGTRGHANQKEYQEWVDGIEKLGSYVFRGRFTIDTAVVCASKAAYLSSLIMKNEGTVKHFQPGTDISSWVITNQSYNKLNKLKKTSPESFFYFYRALSILGLALE
jgi:predicted nucleotidyltransferase component of viral defense system